MRLLALGILVLMLSCLPLLLLWRSPCRWELAYSKIKLGMTEQEVVAAVGLPPGYYEGEVPRPLSMSRWVKPPPLRQSGISYEELDNGGLDLRAWVGRDYVVWVAFDRQGRAVGSFLLELYPEGSPEPSPIRWIRNLLRQVGL
jgi:hypothetical protein